MNLRRAIIIACLVPLFAGAANGQFQPVQPAAPQQEPPPCIKEFFKLRDDAESKGKAIKAANDRKASPKEACQLFGAFVAAQSKMLKYASENTTWCGIPPQVVENLKLGVTKMSKCVTDLSGRSFADAARSQSERCATILFLTQQYQNRRGTFDTLTGNPLGK